jgi:signal transduction histidine kinase
VIRVRCPEGLAPARTDRTKLRTVLANLLSNACKFTRKGTIRVAVSQTTEGGTPSLVVEVSDTGIGIRPEEIDRLFAAFVQADGSTTRRHDGSGLGLTLAHHFCAMLGGEITVESTPGVGSCFRVRVPREFLDPRRAGHVLSSMATAPPR